ncbi:MAG: hypothetical protein ACKV2U_13865 [Bryobacteraceae bacterium]
MTTMITAFAAVVGMANLAPASAAVLKGTVPFDFQAGLAHVKAGTYLIDIDKAGAMLSLRTEEGKRIAFVIANAAVSTKPQTAKLIFRQVGSQYFLGQVWAGGGNSTGSEMPVTKAERAMRKEVKTAGGVRVVEIPLRGVAAD